jgi:predicted ATPase
MEAIVRIFCDLDLEEPTAFPYEIEYFCHGSAIRITNVVDQESSSAHVTRYRRTYEVGDGQSLNLMGDRRYEHIREQEFYKRNRRPSIEENNQRLLPKYVFGYYSGDLSRFENIFSKHEERYYNQQVKGEEAPLRALFLARPHHSQFAFLSFFAIDDVEAREFLKREMRIEGLDSVLFALREPYWNKGGKHSDLPGADARFWGAAGKVAPFLASLFENAFLPMAFKERLKVLAGPSETKERRYCFLPNSTALQRLARGISGKKDTNRLKDFFSRLESLVFSNLVSPDGSDVRIWIKLRGVESAASFNDLAEGERQLLTVLGLLRFTAEDEALFILDEPDTHLNPAWCLDYLQTLSRYGADLQTSQVLMTTHSPLTFAGLDRNEVVILERGADGKIFAEHPTTAPKGMGFSAILTSDFFGLRSELDRATLELIDEKRRLGLKEDKTDADRQRLSKLDQDLGRLDFSKAARDPLYLEFIRAMTQAQTETPNISEAVPTTEDWRKRKRIATDMAKRLGGQRDVK